MKNIAVAVDFSSSSEALLEKAQQMANVFKSKIWLIHVVEPEPDFIGFGVGPQYIREDRAKTIRKEHSLLDGYKKDLVADGIETEALLIQGPTVSTLLDELEKLNIDLLMIGKKGHGALYRAFIGSTFTGIIQKVDIPVLAVPFLEEDK